MLVDKVINSLLGGKIKFPVGTVLWTLSRDTSTEVFHRVELPHGGTSTLVSPQIPSSKLNGQFFFGVLGLRGRCSLASQVYFWSEYAMQV